MSHWGHLIIFSIDCIFSKKNLTILPVECRYCRKCNVRAYRGQLARFFTIIRFNWMRSYAPLLYHSHRQKRSIHYSAKRAIASEPGYWKSWWVTKWPPIHLHLIFEISSLKNQVWQTWCFVYFKLDFYCLCSLQKSSSK